MSKGGRGLTDDEKTLWRRVASRVKARRPAQIDEQPPKAANPVRRVAALSGEPRQTAPAKPRDASPPQNRGGEKRVRRGRIEIGGTLDLHGHNQNTAPAALERFLVAAQRRGARTVIVITGVGRGGQGVLRRRFPDWLAAAELRPIVSGFAQAHKTHGGEGAYYVFLRARRSN